MQKMQYTIESLKEHVAGRKIYLYGAGPRGKTWFSFFRHHGFPVIGFIDKSKKGANIVSPDIINKPGFRDNHFIFMMVQNAYVKEIEQLLIKNNLEKNTHYINHTQLCSYYPTIEVSGICNLKCMSCNLGSPSDQRNSGGFMSLSTYKKILDKLIEDIPLLPNVYLYCWGEPLLNPELPQIIEYTSKRGLGVEISTNLNRHQNLEKVIAASPAYLLVPCSGIGKNYERTHTGGNWKLFEQNLHKLKEYIDKYQAETSVEIIYHTYKHNLSEDYDYMENLSKSLGFYFKPIIANIFPERILEHVAYGMEIPAAMKEINKTMIYTIEEQVKYSQNERKKCVMMDAFPVIRWNGSVIPCCNMEGGTLADDYMTLSFKELKKRQRQSNLCRTCNKFSLQRVFYITGKIQTIDSKRTVIKT